MGRGREVAGVAPADGTDWKPRTSGNAVSWDGAAVVKNYGARIEDYERELGVMRVLTEHLPVPRPLPGSHFGNLRLPFVDGLDGKHVCDADEPGRLMFELGAFLRRLQQLDTAIMEGVLTGDGEVIVHGDFAHYNAVMSPGGDRLVAVLDWEQAHLGDTVSDLAWCEWQLRCAYPQHGWAVAHLFEGYGTTPPAEAREAEVGSRLAELRDEGARRREAREHSG